MTVDSDLTNYNDLVGSVVNKYPLGYMEVVHVQYYDEVLKSFPEITTDQQLMTMFAESSITPSEEAPSASMSFPPRFPILYLLQCHTCCHFHFKPVIDSKFLPSDHSQSLETTTKKKRKSDDCTPATSKSQSLEVSSNKKGKYGSSNSGASKRSRSGSNQPEALSIDFSAHKDQPRKAKAKKRVTFKTKKKELGKEKIKKPQVILNSPAMGTRSKAS